MPLAPGTQLGPYEITVPLGAGGMGEVYRARDKRLERTVAIKILPADLSNDSVRKQRFEREAKTISSLNHPHICVLYDVGHQDGADYLVMEYLEGETLAQRLQKGPLPIQQVLLYAIEIADALDKAHRKGITHRDLKPGNIMLTKSGTKLLDFGLAKLAQEAAPATPDSQLPTINSAITSEGVILGTLQYMAPEQLEGKTDQIDARTDIFAFGAVVYEMATGKKAFEGKSSASIMAKIMEAEPPPISSLQPMTPPALDRTVSICLAKDPDARWQSASDLKRELKWIGDSSSQVALAPPARSPSRLASATVNSVAWGIAALLALFGLGLSFVHFRETHPEEPNLRFRIPVPTNAAEMTISPDGRYLVFSASGDGSGPMVLRALNSLVTRPLPGSEGGTFPFWSPDSKSIGFFAAGKLKRIEVAGGPATVLADAASPTGGAWGPHEAGDVILFSPSIASPLMSIPASGGTVSAVTKLRTGEAAHRFPAFLPDGKHFTYGASREANNVLHQVIHVSDLSFSDDKVIGESDSQGVYSQGFLLFSRQGNLLAQLFDAQRRVTTADAFLLEQRIDQYSGPVGGYAPFSVSANGLLAFLSNSGSGSSQLTWVDRRGKQSGLLGKPANIRDFKFSPDQQSVVATFGPGSAQNNSILWILDALHGGSTRFTFDAGFDSDPVWSPDGRSIIFASRKEQYSDLYRKSANGAGNEELVYSDSLEKTPTDWSADGRFLLYRTKGTANGTDIWVLPLTPERPGAGLKPYPFAQTPYNEEDGRFSPDGKWIAYNSDESQRVEVYVAHFPDGGGKRQISVAGGSTPRWRKDGKEIYYIAADGKVMSAAVVLKGDAIQIGDVQPLFTPPANLSIDAFEVFGNGQRFLILPQQEVVDEGVTVVLNWAAALKK